MSARFAVPTAFALAAIIVLGCGDEAATTGPHATAGAGGTSVAGGSGSSGHAGAIASAGSGGMIGAAGSSDFAGNGGAAGSGGEGGSSGSAIAPKRTLITRPILGRADPDDLFADPDFEMTRSVNQLVDAWLNFTTDLQYETGGLCHSGLVCARLPAGQSLLGIGASAASAPMVASVWIKTTTGACTGVTVDVVNCMSAFEGSVTGVVLDGSAAVPDESGYCQLVAGLPPTTEASCLYVKNATKGDVLVDDASLKIAPVGSSNALPGAGPIDPDAAEATLAGGDRFRHPRAPARGNIRAPWRRP